MLRKLLTATLSKYKSIAVGLKSRHLTLSDGDYFTKYQVPHYSERCGFKKFGASSEKEYDYWWRRACGMVSLHMVMDAMKPNKSVKLNVFEEIQNGIKGGAYQKYEKNGEMFDIGWIHSGLIKIANRRGIKGVGMLLSLDGICKSLHDNKLVIASVANGVSRFEDNSMQKSKSGGHLIVIKGFSWKDGKCIGLYIEDPFDVEAREKPIAASLFDDIYSGRTMIFSANS